MNRSIMHQFWMAGKITMGTGAVVIFAAAADQLSGKTSITLGEAMVCTGVVVGAAWWLARTYQKFLDEISLMKKWFASMEKKINGLRCVKEKECPVEEEKQND